MIKNKTTQLIFQTIYCTLGFVGIVASLGIYLRKSVRNMLLSMSADSLSPLPIDMLTDHLTNTLMLVFGYRFDGRGEKISKEKTKEYLFRLISGNLNITIPRWE